MRASEVAFIKEDRLHGIPDRGYAELAPDLVAEIVSPDHRAGELLAKVADWLRAGIHLPAGRPVETLKPGLERRRTTSARGSG